MIMKFLPQNAPFTDIHANKNLWDGFESRLIQTLASYCNLTLHYEQFNGQYGSRQSNGTWSGIIQKIFVKVCNHHSCFYKNFHYLN